MPDIPSDKRKTYGSDIMDKLVKGLAGEGTLLVSALVDTDTVERARSIHGTLPTATAAFGRLLSGALLMGCTLDEGQKITLQIESKGPVRGMVAEADALGGVRGYVKNPEVHLDIKNGKLDVGRAVGEGYLNVIRDLGLRDPYRGTVTLVSGEVAEDLAWYLNSSEQIPSVVALGVYVEPDNSVSASGGFMIQAMPGAEDETLDYLEERMRTVRPVTAMIREGLGPEDMLHEALGMPVRFTETRETAYRCPCDRERILDSVAALGKEDLTELASEGKALEITCQFCGTGYEITPEEVSAMIEAGEKRD